MLYVQITTKCNFKCEHCMFSCRPGKGMHMTLETFKAAGEFAKAESMGIFIGGGEPTLHPQFWEIAGLCMYYNADFCEGSASPPLHLVTNGSKTKDALALAHLASVGYASVRLSRDQFHLPFHIDESVVRAFKQGQEDGISNRRYEDCRETGGEIYNVVPVGRAKLRGWTKDRWGKKGCNSCGTMVTPDGKIWRCACKKEQLGTVFKPAHVDWYDDSVQDGCTTRDGRLVADTTNNDLLVSQDAPDALGLLFRDDIQDLPEVATQLTETKEGVAL